MQRHQPEATAAARPHFPPNASLPTEPTRHRHRAPTTGAHQSRCEKCGLAQSPTISGAVSGQTIAPLETDTPFSSVRISDPNQDTSDTLTIQLTGGGGTLTDGAGFDGLTMSAPGVYVLSGTAAEITSELDALVFTPSAGTGTRTFTLTDASTAGRSASNAKTTVNVDSNPPPVVVSVPMFLANKSSLDQTPAASTFLALRATLRRTSISSTNSHINSITILDNNLVAPSVQQLTSDAKAIGKLENANSSPVLLAVDDTAADIENGLSTLVADTGEIASITSSKGQVAVSVSTLLADQSTLDKIIGGFTISDTAANVAQNLDALSNDTNVTSIGLTDGGVPTLSISLEEAENDTRALDAITTPHMIVIADSAAATITSTEAIYLSGENIAVDGAGASHRDRHGGDDGDPCADRNIAPRKPRLHPGSRRYGGEYPGADTSPDQQSVGARRASHRVRTTRAWRCRRSWPNLSKPRI